MALTKYFSKSVSVYEDASGRWDITVSDFAGHAVTWSSAWSTGPVCGITTFSDGTITWRCATGGTYKFTWTASDLVTGNTAVIECTIIISGVIPPDGSFSDYYPFFTNTLTLSEGQGGTPLTPDAPETPVDPSPPGTPLEPPQTYVSNIPCPIRISCPGSDFPITNYSAEGPQDVSTHIGVVYPTTWFKGGCLSICESTVSQEEADQCALAQEAACNPPPPPILYCNTEQTVEVACSDGITISSFTAQSGLFCAFTSQADVDAQALAYAQLQANALCPPPGGGTLYCSNEQTCSYVCPTTLETITFTAPASLFCAYTSQAEVDAFAYDFACGQAASRCPPTIDPPGSTTFLNTPQTCITTCPNSSSQYYFTVPAGLFAAPTQAAANANAYAYACDRARLNLVCINTINEYFCLGSLYQQQLSVTGGTVIRWELVSGELPNGITLSDSGLIEGTTSELVPHTFSVKVYLTNGNYGVRQFTLHAMQIQPDALPDRQIGVYFIQELSLYGYTGSVSWLVISGALPSGLSLDTSTGIITGTPTDLEPYTFTVRASPTQVPGGQLSCIKEYEVSDICPKPEAPSHVWPDLWDNKWVSTTGAVYQPAVTSATRWTANPANAFHCMDIFDFSLSPPAKVYELFYPFSGVVYYGGYYEPTTNIIAAVLRDSSTGSDVYSVNFIDPVTGFISRQVFTMDLFWGMTTMPIRGTHKVAFYQVASAGNVATKIWIADCDTKTVQELTIVPVDGERMWKYASYCCVSNEFAIISFVSSGGLPVVNTYYLKMVSVSTGAEMARYLMKDPKDFGLIYADSTERLIYGHATGWDIIDPLTGLIDSTASLPSQVNSGDDVYFGHYIYTLDNVACGLYDQDLGTNVVGFFNPVDMSFIKETDFQSIFDSANYIVSSHDDGSIFFRYHVHDDFAQIRPIIL